MTLKLDDNIRAALVGGSSCNIDSKLSNVVKISEQSIQFVPASKPFENETKYLKSKYIYVNALNSLNGSNVKFNGLTSCSNLSQPSTSNAYWPDPASKCNGPQVPTPQFQVFPVDGVKLTWSQSLRQGTGVGLNNLGNTCFLNSILQVLSNTPPLVNYVFSEHHERQSCPSQNGFCAICALKAHVRRIFTVAKSRQDSISPQLIVQRLRCVMKNHTFGRQQDAHEFLRYFVDSMQTASLFNFKDRKLDLFTKETSVVGRIFGGFHKNDITCLCCRSISTTFDPFLDISLEIKHVSNIEMSLQHFTRQETLSSDNAYKCPKCNKKVAAHKSYTINVPPNILTLQLKRFDHMGKIDKFVAYPEKLNLRSYMSQKQGPPVIYKLYGVVVHSGRSTNSGHYYSFVRNPLDQWHIMDDSRVCIVETKTVLQAYAYVLFYVRVPLQTATVLPQPKLPVQLQSPTSAVSSPMRLYNGSDNVVANSKMPPHSKAAFLAPQPATISSTTANTKSKAPVQPVAPLAFLPRQLVPNWTNKKPAATAGVPLVSEQPQSLLNGAAVDAGLTQTVTSPLDTDSQRQRSVATRLWETENVSSSPNASKSLSATSVNRADNVSAIAITSGTGSLSSSSDSDDCTPKRSRQVSPSATGKWNGSKAHETKELVAGAISTSSSVVNGFKSVDTIAKTSVSSVNGLSSDDVKGTTKSGDCKSRDKEDKDRHRQRNSDHSASRDSRRNSRHTSRNGSSSHDSNKGTHDSLDKNCSTDFVTSAVERRKRKRDDDGSERRHRRRDSRESHRRKKQRGVDDSRKRQRAKTEVTRVELSAKREEAKNTPSSADSAQHRALDHDSVLVRNGDKPKLSKKLRRQMKREEKRRLKQQNRTEKLRKVKEEAKRPSIATSAQPHVSLTPLEFLKRFCTKKVMTWDTAQPNASDNFAPANGTIKNCNGDDSYNDEYDRGKVKKERYSNGRSYNMEKHDNAPMNVFQKTLEQKYSRTVAA